MLNHPLKSFLYNLFLRNFFRKNKFPLKQKIFNWINKPGYSIKTKLYGKAIIMPSGYQYPFTCRRFPNFNNPLLELAWHSLQVKNEKLNIIDAGAAVGDTLLLLKQNLPPESATIYCIEGDLTFAGFLSENAKQTDGDVRVIKTVLSSRKEFIPALVHHHSSSLIALGKNETAAFPLDDVWKKEINKPIDIIKTDLEGFDGKVIAGTTDILCQFSPSVIFEFHPLLINQTGNDFMEAFDVLARSGYEKLLWFSKYGDFISQTTVYDKEYIQKMIQQSLTGGAKEDIHFDIIAPGKRNAPDLKKLTECQYAKTKKYSY